MVEGAPRVIRATACSASRSQLSAISSRKAYAPSVLSRFANSRASSARLHQWVTSSTGAVAFWAIGFPAAAPRASGSQWLGRQMLAEFRHHRAPSTSIAGQSARYRSPKYLLPALAEAKREGSSHSTPCPSGGSSSLAVDPVMLKVQ